MSEKRFEDIEVSADLGWIRLYTSDEDYEDYDGDEVLDMLNNQHEENQRLKRQICNLEHTRDFCAECCERLEKENEQLKSEIRKVQREYEQLWMRIYK